MTPLEGKATRRLIQSRLISGSNVNDLKLLRDDWRGLIFDNYRYHDDRAGNISDSSFSRISDASRSLYDDQRLYLVAAERFDSTREDQAERLPETRESENSLDGYASFKRDPGLFEFYLFGDSLKWVAYANSDWTVVAGEQAFFDRLVREFGGTARILSMLDAEIGLPEPNENVADTERKWLDFVIRILGVSMSEIMRHTGMKKSE